MTGALLAFAAVVMTGCAFVSGIFGMAGGLILIGVLLALLPVPQAMTLHAVTQMTSNGWRSFLWIKFVRWRFMLTFLAGSAIAFTIWTHWRYVPSKPVAFLLLGASPFLVRIAPARFKPDPSRLAHGLFYGSLSMSLMLLTGVTGPLIDTYFLGGTLDRREMVATKSACQIVNHTAKLLYFGGLVKQAAGGDPPAVVIAVAASIIGTSLARPILERLTDGQFRAWTNHIITAIGATYLVIGGYLLLRSSLG